MSDHVCDLAEMFSLKNKTYYMWGPIKKTCFTLLTLVVYLLSNSTCHSCHQSVEHSGVRTSSVMPHKYHISYSGSPMAENDTTQMTTNVSSHSLSCFKLYAYYHFLLPYSMQQESFLRS